MVLRRVYTVYGIHSSSLSDPSIQNIEKIWEPKLAAFQDEITQNDALFQRIGTVYQNRDTADLTPEQRRLLTVVYQGFVRAGANLSEDDKGRLSEINQRLALLFTQFSQNVLAEEEHHFTFLADPSDLEGLPPTCPGCSPGRQRYWT